METGKKMHPTELNKHDRKVLDRYSGFYTNYIESNTAQNDVLDEKRYPGRKDVKSV